MTKGVRNSGGAVVNAVCLMALSAMTAAASAQDAELTTGTGAARSVDLRTAPEVPPVAPPPGLVINRPTIPMADYLAAKQAAATTARRPKPAHRP